MSRLMRAVASVPFIGMAIVAAPAIFGCGACASGAGGEPPPAASADHRAVLQIEHMTCASCSVTVKTAANKLTGVVSIDVQVTAGQATVTFDSSTVTAAQIAAKITDAGYPTTVLSDGEA